MAVVSHDGVEAGEMRHASCAIHMSPGDPPVPVDYATHLASARCNPQRIALRGHLLQGHVEWLVQLR
jgi:hypothetical protein